MPNSNPKGLYPLIVVPTHDGRIFVNSVTSMLQISKIFGEQNIPFDILFHQGESLITRARNNCVAYFLEHTHFTHLFWLDSDIGFSPDSFFRILNSGYDVVGGVYPLKTEGWPETGLPQNMTEMEFKAKYQRYTVNLNVPEEQEEVTITIQPDGFLEISEIPTGFMCVKRSVFEKMMQTYPELKYVPDSLGVKDKGLHYRFFDVTVDPITNRYLSEDYYFCHLWSKMGGKIYVDALSNLTHQGTKVYSGNFAESLLSNFSLAIPCRPGVKMTLTGLDHLRALMK